MGQAPMRPQMNQQRPGMSNKQKLVLLAGAAAYITCGNKKQNAQGQPVQYYRSESNGRIYYRDPRTKQAIYVTPPQGGIQVPADQAQEYSGYSGYQGKSQWSRIRRLRASGQCSKSSFPIFGNALTSTRFDNCNEDCCRRTLL
jgi:hypothetical protein